MEISAVLIIVVLIVIVASALTVLQGTGYEYFLYLVVAGTMAWGLTSYTLDDQKSIELMGDLTVTMATDAPDTALYWEVDDYLNEYRFNRSFTKAHLGKVSRLQVKYKALLESHGINLDDFKTKEKQ